MKALKQFIKKHNNILQFFISIRWIFWSLRFPHRYECSCCGKKFHHYLPFPKYYEEQRKKYSCKEGGNAEMVNTKAYACPYCGASDRERAYASYMIKNLNRDKQLNILDIAPAKNLSNFIKKNFPNANYKTADLFKKGVDYEGLDVTNMPQIKDGTVDFFICSHVLEHVFDDRAAMRELRRILKNDGKGILVVPIDLNRTVTDEDPNCTDVGERWRRFGQGDHVRAYAKEDWLTRLSESDFDVYQYTKKDFGDDVMKKCALKDSSTVYIVRKAQ